MIDVQFDTVLLSPATANAVKVVSTEHVVAHGSRDLSVLGIVGHATVLIFQAALLTCLLSFRLLVIFDKHRDDNFNAPENSSATQVSYQWQYSSTKTGTFSDIKYGGNTNSYEISEEDEDYYLRCKVTTSSSKGKVPDAYSETIGKVYVFDWSKYPTGSYRPRFNGNSLACCTAPYDSSTQIPSLGEGDYASIVFDNELSDIPQGNITYRWFKCAGLGSGAGLVAKELGSSPSLSLSGLQGSYINCEVTLTVNGKSKTFVPKAICNGKVSDGIYVRPRIG